MQIETVLNMEPYFYRTAIPNACYANACLSADFKTLLVPLIAKKRP